MALKTNLKTPLKSLNMVGPIYQKRLQKLGLQSVEDLFFHFPHRYDDYSQIKPISEVQLEQVVTIQGKIIDIQNITSWRKRLKITEALIEDDTGAIKAVWFNQPFLTRNLRPGMNISLSGKIKFSADSLCLSNPAYEVLGTQLEQEYGARHTGGLIPVYHETYGLSSRFLRYLIKPLLYLTAGIADTLPKFIKVEYKLLGLNTALKQIHFPSTPLMAKRAKKRLAFEELFLIQLRHQLAKAQIKQKIVQSIPFQQALVKKFVKSLPFKLTTGQKIALWEIVQDLAKTNPMNRLLQGDVGSGKTVVAAGALLETARTANLQAVFLAPTEILAQQHFQEIHNLLRPFSVPLALLTGKTSRLAYASGQNRPLAKTSLLAKIKQGEIRLVIGTHALLQKSVKFHDLGLIIIDEQHRFGIKQRAHLNQAHFLSMSATPIPRSLALTLYGDLDLSLLTEMPKNRLPIITKIIAPANRAQAYAFIRQQIKAGRQAFVLCPRIEPAKQASEFSPAQLLQAEKKSVKQEFTKLSRQIFPDLKIAMLYGKMKSAAKAKVMADFKNNQTAILVSTSVIEVGIDIPNAAIMMIEGAENFGLSQLHQLRGRVGRGPYQSSCFLFTDSGAKKTRQRLNALLKHNNGFALAEKDLAIRGPGSLIGLRQWGLPDLAMACLTDTKLIQQARQAATQIMARGLDKFPDLKKKVAIKEQTVHLE